MAYDKEEIITICKATAPQYQFEAIQLFALARQECAKTKDGHFDASIPRLEQGFFERYIKGNTSIPPGLSTVSLASLAVSYGCWQIMGYELWRLGWLQEYFDKEDNPYWKNILGNPFSQIAIGQAFDKFCVDLDAQCLYACMLLSEKRASANRNSSFKGATNKEEMTYLFYNGGGDVLYGKKILTWKAMGLV